MGEGLNGNGVKPIILVLSIFGSMVKTTMI